MWTKLEKRYPFDSQVQVAKKYNPHELSDDNLSWSKLIESEGEKLTFLL